MTDRFGAAKAFFYFTKNNAKLSKKINQEKFLRVRRDGCVRAKALLYESSKRYGRDS